ncbi:hypothetical protein GCM10010517_49340 [Streptosporangium fragile]|uniref:Uncharacterized protein n=1 Tax=Streptosporangium fragile TaxID=46186 RepID=A0ABN3W1N9_9ACTN
MVAEIIRAEIMEYVAPMFEQIMARMDTLATKEDLDQVREDVAKCATKEDFAVVQRDVDGVKEELKEVRRTVDVLTCDVGTLKEDSRAMKENYVVMDGKLDRIILLLGMSQN